MILIHHFFCCKPLFIYYYFLIWNWNYIIFTYNPLLSAWLNIILPCVYGNRGEYQNFIILKNILVSYVKMQEAGKYHSWNLFIYLFISTHIRTYFSRVPCPWNKFFMRLWQTQTRFRKDVLSVAQLWAFLLLEMLMRATKSLG